jgi:20S proteasome alpha/beta subunit
MITVFFKLPFRYRRNKGGRFPKRREMTVCIAAACERATKVVVATDRALSYAGIVSDSLRGKMIWIDDWLVLYAGTPANTALIIAALREIVSDKPTSRNVRQAFYSAYCRRKALYSSFPTLSSYDITLETFKTEGLRIFGEAEFTRLSQEIAQVGAEFSEQLLVVGWGDTPNAVMLYEISPDGDRDHHFSGVAAIGSGSDVALSTMMLLGQSRDSSLTQTLYAVAAAKFASEKTSEGDVGRKTCFYITWKRTEGDTEHKPPGRFLEDEHVEQLYALWDRYGRPRIPDQVYLPVNDVLKSLGMASHPNVAELHAILRSASSTSPSDQVTPEQSALAASEPGEEPDNKSNDTVHS